jgi:hypothetical protein
MAVQLSSHGKLRLAWLLWNGQKQGCDTRLVGSSSIHLHTVAIDGGAVVVQYSRAAICLVKAVYIPGGCNSAVLHLD